MLDETLLLFDQAIAGREAAAKAKVDKALSSDRDPPPPENRLSLPSAFP
ncbi:hypothetical protein [Sphaerisporangium perillae]|nr:hypothetical protein [Sphaerisporangium perillae]